MTQTAKKAVVPRLGVLLQAHHEMVTLGQEFIRLAIGARVANRVREAIAAERVAEDYIAKAVRLEERLQNQL